MLLRNNKWEED